MEEFGISHADIIPHAFQRYNENASNSDQFYQQLCWEHLPPELTYGSLTDDWGYPGEPRDSKRELFIANSDIIERLYGELTEELCMIYGRAFYRINHVSDLRVTTIDEVSTCIRYWK